MKKQISEEELSKLNASLFKEIEKSSYDEVIRLIKEGAQLEATNEDGQTPLILATSIAISKACMPNSKITCSSNSVLVVDYLIENSANVNAIDTFGWTAIYTATAFSIQRTHKSLWLNYDADPTPKVTEVAKHICEKLLSYGANVHYENNEGYGPLNEPGYIRQEYESGRIFVHEESSLLELAGLACIACDL